MHFEFKRVDNRSDWGKLFELRETVYAASPIVGSYISDPDVRASFAYHDQDSWHFGLTCHEAGDSEPVGYLRVVLAAHEKLKSWPADSAETPLPMMSQFANPDAAHRWMVQASEKTGILCEAGRFCVVENSRARRLGGLMAAAATSVSLEEKIPTCMICHPKHKAIYESVGFREVLSDETIQAPGGIPAVCMALLPGQCARSARLQCMHAAWARFGKITIDPKDLRFFGPVRAPATVINSIPQQMSERAVA